MVQEWRCDTCSTSGFEDEMVRVVDELGVIWHRHQACCEKHLNGKKLGTQPRSPEDYAELEIEAFIDLEKQGIPFGPPPRRREILLRRRRP